MRKTKKNSFPTNASFNARSKRRKSSSDVVVVIDQKSALAVKALGIVLQHMMMMPNLGLNCLEKQSFESKNGILKILNTLPESKERDDAIASVKNSTTTTNFELSKIIAENIKERVRNITDVRMTFNIQVSLMFLFYFLIYFFVTASNHYE